MKTERSCVQPVPHYYQVWSPDGKAGKLPALIGLHGYAGDMVSMMRLAESIAEDSMIVASMQGPHQFILPAAESGGTRKTGFGWLTPFRDVESRLRHHQFVRDVREDLIRNFDANPTRIFLMGFSQACALNYRFTFTDKGLLRGVIGVCGGLPGDFASNEQYQPTDASILHIAATEDEFYSTERTRCYEAALRKLATDVIYKEYPSPHVFPRASIPFIQNWLRERCAS